MLTIGHRKAVDRVRSAEAPSRRDTAYEAREQDTPYDMTAEDAHRNLDAQRVRKGLDTLTETQRGALELAYFGGYTHTEVATMLDLPVGTAKTRIRDGLIRLRDNLGTRAMNDDIHAWSAPTPSTLSTTPSAPGSRSTWPPAPSAAPRSRACAARPRTWPPPPTPRRPPR